MSSFQFVCLPLATLIQFTFGTLLLLRRVGVVPREVLLVLFDVDCQLIRDLRTLLLILNCDRILGVQSNGEKRSFTTYSTKEI